MSDKCKVCGKAAHVMIGDGDEEHAYCVEHVPMMTGFAGEVEISAGSVGIRGDLGLTIAKREG